MTIKENLFQSYTKDLSLVNNKLVRSNFSGSIDDKPYSITAKTQSPHVVLLKLNRTDFFQKCLRHGFNDQDHLKLKAFVTSHQIQPVVSILFNFYYTSS
jgi:hypothetical protein